MSIKRVLVPVDKSEKTLESLEQLKVLFKKEDVQVVLLHVIDDFNTSVVDYVSEEYLETVKTLSTSLLDRAAENIKGYDVIKMSLIGSPTKEILEAMDTQNIDLVIMTKVGAGSLEKYILGSVTSKVVKKADVPILIIP
ncbi:MAG: universal stress protein [Peptostreptococcaceae bacterium]